MNSTNKLLENLNEPQRQAVETIDGPVLVFAGAGTGKTKTLTTRIAYMIEEKKIAPQNILAITFTKKAANEMKQRVSQMIGSSGTKVMISTIHSFCARVLRKTITVLGYRHDFDILDEDESLKIIGECFKELNIDRKYISPKYAASLISNYKNNLVQLLISPVSKIYELYARKLKQNNLLDFDDLIRFVLEIFNDQPEILAFYRRIYQYVLVDEFQDTNQIQYQLIKNLAPYNLFVVGDDDQSIYSFRGANLANMLEFKNDYPDVVTIKLIQNYRSTNFIVSSAKSVINNNKIRETKELFSDIEGDNNDVIINEGYYFEDEVRYVINEINSLYNRGLKYQEMAILYRNNIISRNFELALIENKIPYQIYGGFSYLKRKEVKDVIAYLKFILDHNSVHSFRRIINQPPRGIGEKTLTKFDEIMESQNLTLFEAIDYLHQSINSSKTQVLVEFKQLIIDLAEKINQMPLDDFFDYMIKETGYLEMLEADHDPDNNRIENIKEFKSILFKLQLRDFEEELTGSQRLRIAFDDIILDEGSSHVSQESGVTLSTIHSAKGLEFSVVFVVALEEGIFPTIREDTDFEEERRIAYVAFTRAKKKLFLTCANRRLIYGRIVRNQKSRFLNEYLTSKEYQKNVNPTTLPKGLNLTELKVGSKINHFNFGEGLVIAVDDMTMQVLFEKDNSIRRLLKDHPSITIIG